jgi:hypothetical protein
MKVWKMQDLGLQTLQLVRTAANQGTVTTAMARLAQIVHNFPAFAGMVSSTKVSTAVREEVQSYTGEGGACVTLLRASGGCTLMSYHLTSSPMFQRGRNFVP